MSDPTTVHDHVVPVHELGDPPPDDGGQGEAEQVAS
jgi:hypothetical protein